MWENEESDIFEEADRRIDTILEEIHSGSINWLFDLRKNLLLPPSTRSRSETKN